MMEGSAKKELNFYEKIRGKVGQVDTLLGRRLLGNDTNLTRQIISFGIMNGIRLQAQYKSPEGPRLFDAQDMHEKGYMVFENVYEPEFVNAVRKKVTKAFEDPAKTAQRQGKYSLFLKDFDKEVPEVKDILTPGILNALQDYYNAYVDLGTVTCWRNLPPDADAPFDIYSSAWHTDRRLPILMRMFYLVHDTDETMGPFHVFNKPDSVNLMKHYYKGRKEPLQIADNHPGLYRLTGKAGTILIGNLDYCLHKAGMVGQGKYRDIIQFVFMPSAKPLAANWQDDPYYFRHRLGSQGRWNLRRYVNDKSTLID